MNASKFARYTDPVTSHAAAARVAEFSEAYCGYIYRALQTHGPGTFEDIARWTGMRGSQIWRRLPDLERDGLAQPTGGTKKGSTGRQQRLWEAL